MNYSRTKMVFRCFVYCSLLLLTHSVFATSLFTARINLPGDISSVDNLTNAVLSDDITFPDGREASAFSIAASQRLGALVSASVPELALNPGQFISIASGASARAQFDDIVITNSSDPSNLNPIEVTTNFFLDGRFIFAPGVEDGDTLTSAGVSVVYGFGSGPANAPNTIGGITRDYQNGAFSASNSGIFSSAGLGSAFVVNDIFETTTLTVPVGTPLRLTLEMVISANAVSRNFSAPNPIIGESSAVTTDFLYTLSFATSGPVFNLPQGYTVDSVQAGIVNNALVAVPLPAALYLLLPALLAVGGARRRRLSGKI